MYANLILVIAFLPLTVLADTVSYDQLFSKENFKGGVACAALSSDGYLNEATLVYEKPTLTDKIKEKKKLKSSCTQGGGDCACYALYLDTVKSTGSKAFYKVKADDSAEVWVLAEKKSVKEIEILATETKDGEIEFRQPITALFKDRLLEGTLTKEQLLKVPGDIQKQIPAKNTTQNVLLTLKATEVLKSRQVSRLSVDLVTYDPEDQTWNESATERNSQKRFHLRDVWIQTFDSSGRINFWLSQVPGC